MRLQTPSRWIRWAGLTALVILVGWSWIHLAASRLAAETAAADLRQCQAVVNQLKTLSHGPQKASLVAHSIQGLAGTVEQSVKAADLPLEALTGIAPQSSQRVGESDYREQQIRLKLRDVTIRQLVLFLDALTQHETNMKVAELWLYTSDTDNASPEETWGAEVTLTHLIFSPYTPSSHQR